MPTAVLEVELDRPWEDILVAPRYASALVLLRWRGTPIGASELKIRAGRITPDEIWRAARRTAGQTVTAKILDDLLKARVEQNPYHPPCTIVVCTRDRAQDLSRCLSSLCAAADSETDILVVDNASSDESTAHVAAAHGVRCVREPRPGLNWARACGLRNARHELVLFTDDDVVVDAEWRNAMCEPFEDGNVAGVAGLLLPLELETEAQEMYRRSGGFAHRFQRISFNSARMLPAAAGQIGAGASMGFRRSVALELKLFDHEIDCGTAALSGGDHYAFYLALRAGHSIVFTPEALCWHRDRRTLRELERMMYGYSVGVYCYLLRCLIEHRDPGAIRVGVSWFLGHHVPELIRSFRGRSVLPRRYCWAAVRGVFAAPAAYRKTKRAEAAGGRASRPTMATAGGSS